MFRNRNGQAALRASVLMSLMIFGGGCSVESVDAPADGSGGDGPAVGSGVRRIQVDGSSTVAKVAAAVQEEFESRFTDTKVALKVTGSGTGFKEMIAGRIDVANASRAVKDSELADCAANGIELLELRIALDGLTVCVNAKNDWVDSVTVGSPKLTLRPCDRREARTSRREIGNLRSSSIFSISRPTLPVAPATATT